MSSYQSGNIVSEIWLQWFSCCINEPAQSRKKRTRSGIRIDRSMIGLPTDFQHTIHIGSNDIELNNSAVRALQNQMQSKGGYETSYTALKAC
ncbi:CDC42 small effector protein homolog [Planococcus citri]|uniref:CDC42 small effector protein homolog n=1 Tax=Planococcus citri TaxID=170843 RepID=UPI0031F9C868